MKKTRLYFIILFLIASGVALYFMLLKKDFNFFEYTEYNKHNCPEKIYTKETYSIPINYKIRILGRLTYKDSDKLSIEYNRGNGFINKCGSTTRYVYYYTISHSPKALLQYINKIVFIDAEAEFTEGTKKPQFIGLKINAYEPFEEAHVKFIGPVYTNKGVPFISLYDNFYEAKLTGNNIEKLEKQNISYMIAVSGVGGGTLDELSIDVQKYLLIGEGTTQSFEGELTMRGAEKLPNFYYKNSETTEWSGRFFHLPVLSSNQALISLVDQNKKLNLVGTLLWDNAYGYVFKISEFSIVKSPIIEYGILTKKDGQYFLQVKRYNLCPSDSPCDPPPDLIPLMVDLLDKTKLDELLGVGVVVNGTTEAYDISGMIDYEIEVVTVNRN